MKVLSDRSHGLALIAIALLAILYFAGAKIGVELTVMPEGTAILWIPNSVLLAAFIIFGGRHYVQFALVAVAAEVAADMPTFRLEEALLFGVVNVGEATLAFLLLRYWKFDPRFGALADTFKFVMAGPLIAALAAALCGAAIYSSFRGDETSYLEFARIWWFGDAIGLLTFTPLFLAFWHQPSRRSGTAGYAHIADGVMALLTIIVLMLLLRSREGSVLGMHVGPIMLLPLVAYAAARFDMRVAASAAAVVAILISAMTTGGYHLFGTLTPREAAIQAQEYIFIMSIVAIGLSALMTQLRARERELDAVNRNLVALNRDLEQTVEERTSELSRVNAQLAHLALTDPLTGLFNRRAVLASVDKELQASRRYGRESSLLILDLDNFKSINDRHGHDAGDVVLKEFVRVVQRAVRAGDTFARYGGEEFVLLAPGTGLDGAVMLANRILSALREEQVSIGGTVVRVTASIGVTVFDPADPDAEAAFKRADQALYFAKARGRDRAVAEVPRKR